MSAWVLAQLVFDLFFLLGSVLIGLKLLKGQKEDPRLTKGLQVLQGKISVLEDLSDRTEAQVKELNSLLDMKARDVQTRVELAEQQIAKIRKAMEESLEVAKIFQDKIPHQEIIERKNTIKYVKAARMAHAGAGVEEIASTLDLPTSEVEFIVKINRDGLVFDESQLPPWARLEDSQVQAAEDPALSSPVEPAPIDEKQEEWIENLSRTQFGMKSLDLELSKYKSEEPVPAVNLAELGLKFRQAEASQAQPSVANKIGIAGGRITKKVQRVEFPRITAPPK